MESCSQINKKSYDNWPCHFKFPIENLRMDIILKLNTKSKLEKNEINEIIRSVYIEMKKYERYKDFFIKKKFQFPITIY